MKEADVKTVVEISDKLPAEARSLPKENGEGSKKVLKMTRTEPDPCVHTVLITDELDAWPNPKPAKAKKTQTSVTRSPMGAKVTNARIKNTAKKSKARSKARNGNEKLTPAAIYRKMIAFGKCYQVEKEQDFIEAARIYAEEAGLIDQIRDQIAEEGLTVLKTYKTGDVPVAHPLLSELPLHVESANKCLATIGNMIGERGARVEKAARDLDAFRLH